MPVTTAILKEDRMFRQGSSLILKLAPQLAGDVGIAAKLAGSPVMLA